MPRNIMNVIESRCVGCRICEQWCSYSHGRVNSPSTTNIRVMRIHHAYRNVPVVCRQCGKPACIAACEFGALTVNKRTGAIQVHESKCTACRRCMHACPYGAVNYDSHVKIPRICDLCGGSPQCVTHCAEQAIEYRDETAIVEERRRNIAEKRGGK